MTNSSKISSLGTPLRPMWPKGEKGSVMIWRYFKPSRFTDFLNTGKIYFASAREFTDKFEGATAVLAPDLPEDPRYKGLSQIDSAFEELRRLTKISCWHIEKDESAAMWQLYADAGKGVA